MEIAQRVSASDLRGADVFAGLSDENLEQIGRVCTQRTYKPGEYCAIEGETTAQLLIVNGGKVAVETRVDVLRYSYTVTIATLTKGRVCAWSALVPPHILTASLRCLEDTQMISIRDSDLQRIFAEKPAIKVAVMSNLAAVISSRLRDSRTQLTRLIAELIKEGVRQGR